MTTPTTARKSCRACGHETSRPVDACPNCGDVYQTTTTTAQCPGCGSDNVGEGKTLAFWYCRACCLSFRRTPPTTAQHTPGPWTHEVNAMMQGQPLLIRAADGSILTGLNATGEIVGRDKGGSYNGRPSISAVDLANARLIAAAPALLAALEAIAKGMHHITLSGAASRHLDCPPCIAEAAIRQARGE